MLFREPIAVNDERTTAYYQDKVILITGGGSSIGSELCRQLAKMNPKQYYSRYLLGSAGSVIPLFKKQITNGGPVTLTDKCIIRYFMTIPEASQLVLASGAMANNGELFILDRGQPVRILDLAENMIRLSGVQGIEIIETGLRPREKLYKEFLVKTEELDNWIRLITV